MTEFTLNIRHLLAVNHASSTEKTRYYLNGVHVEFLPYRTIYVATDGHVLLASQHETSNPVGLEPIIVSNKSIKLLKPAKHLTTAGDTDVFTLNNGKLIGSSHILNVIDGTFPDWRRVLPRECSGKLAHYDYAQMKPFLDVARKFPDLCGRRDPRIMHNDNVPAFVHMGGNDLFGMIMPFRCSTGHIDRPIPDWV